MHREQACRASMSSQAAKLYAGIEALETGREVGGHLPNAWIVYVGREQQGVVLVPGHASDLVWHPLNHKWLCIHLVQVVQP